MENQTTVFNVTLTFLELTNLKRLKGLVTYQTSQIENSVPGISLFCAVI